MFINGIGGKGARPGGWGKKGLILWLKERRFLRDSVDYGNSPANTFEIKEEK